MTTVLEENEIQNMFYSLSLGAFRVNLSRIGKEAGHLYNKYSNSNVALNRISCELIK